MGSAQFDAMYDFPPYCTISTPSTISTSQSQWAVFNIGGLGFELKVVKSQQWAVGSSTQCMIFLRPEPCQAFKSGQSQWAVCNIEYLGFELKVVNSQLSTVGSRQY